MLSVPTPPSDAGTRTERSASCSLPAIPGATSITGTSTSATNGDEPDSASASFASPSRLLVQAAQAQPLSPGGGAPVFVSPRISIAVKPKRASGIHTPTTSIAGSAPAPSFLHAASPPPMHASPLAMGGVAGRRASARQSITFTMGSPLQTQGQLAAQPAQPMETIQPHPPSQPPTVAQPPSPASIPSPSPSLLPAPLLTTMNEAAQIGTPVLVHRSLAPPESVPSLSEESLAIEPITPMPPMTLEPETTTINAATVIDAPPTPKERLPTPLLQAAQNSTPTPTHSLQAASQERQGSPLSPPGFEASSPQVNPRRASAAIFSAGNSTLVLGGSAEHTLCGMCERSVATIHCQDCGLNLCVGAPNECNRVLHAPAKMRTHTRVPLVNGVPNHDHARPGTSSSSQRPGTSGGARGSLLQPSEPQGVHSGLSSFRGSRGGGRGSMRPNEMMPPSPSPSPGILGTISSPGLSPRPPSSSAATPRPPSSSAATPRPPTATALAAKDEDDSSEEEDNTDSLALARDALVAQLTGPSCDQCHLAEAVLYCIDCQSSLCDSESSTASCNKRIHKARSMARHRQVRIEERDDIMAQLEEEEQQAALSDLPATAAPLTPGGAGGARVPRASFIAPLSSRSLLSPSSIASKRSSFGSGGMSPLLHMPLSPAASTASGSPLSPDQNAPMGFGHSRSRANSNSLVSPPSSLVPRPPLTPSSSGSFARPPLTPTGNHLQPRPPSGARSMSPLGLPPSSPGGADRLSPHPPLHRHHSSSSSTRSGPTGSGEEPEFDPEFTGGSPQTSAPSSAASADSRRGSFVGGAGRPPPRPHSSSGMVPSATDGTPLPSPAPSPRSGQVPSSVLEALFDAEGVLAPRSCDNCDEHSAESYCVECKMSLCTLGQCQQLIHRPTKMKSHQIFSFADLQLLDPRVAQPAALSPPTAALV